MTMTFCTVSPRPKTPPKPSRLDKLLGETGEDAPSGAGARARCAEVGSGSAGAAWPGGFGFFLILLRI